MDLKNVSYLNLTLLNIILLLFLLCSKATQKRKGVHLTYNSGLQSITMKEVKTRT